MSMLTSIQIIEGAKSAWDLVKMKIENISEKSFDFLPYFPSQEETFRAFLFHRPHILIADLKVLNQYRLSVLEELLIQHSIKTKLIILVDPVYPQGLQEIVEIGIAALVVKPITTSNLVRAVLRAESIFERETNKEKEVKEHFITFKANRSRLYLNQQDIIFVESNRNICSVMLKDGTLRTVNENISSIEQRLLAPCLVRIDKSTILNTSKVIYLGSEKYSRECRLKLDNGSQISKTISKKGMIRLYEYVADNIDFEAEIKPI